MKPVLRHNKIFNEDCDNLKFSGPNLKNVYKRSPASIPGWEFSEANKDVSCR